MNQLKNAFALIIGVGDEELDTVSDALDINDILIDEQFAGYYKENVILVTGENATRKGILEGFKLLQEKTTENSSIFLYYSGHGGFQAGEYFIQPYGMTNEMNEEEFKNAWVSAKELKENINQLNSKRLIFFLDCCQAEGMTKGGLFFNKKEKKKDLGNHIIAKSANKFNKAEGLAQKIDNERGMSIISSCREEQQSFQIDERNSLFTKCLLEVLKGKHRKSFEHPYITIYEVTGYLQREVPKRAKVHDLEQNPYANLQMYDDFTICYVPQKIRSQLVLNEPTEDTVVIEKGQKEVVTVFRETENATNLVLFIHGFSGESTDTFGIIPELLASESKMDGWDLKPLGYTQHVTPELGKNIMAGINDINKISDYLTTSLKYKFDKYDRIAIVAHSLGGLIAQKSILDLKEEYRNKISHLILLGTPNNGFSNSVLNEISNEQLSDLSSESEFIINLRQNWKNEFNDKLPFKIKIAAATSDEIVSHSSCFDSFNEEFCETIQGTHLTMVKPIDKNNDCYHLILNTLTDTEFYNQFTNKEEINLTLGKYDVIVKKLLPNLNSIDTNGLKQLIFSLEGLDRKEEAIEILNEHPLAENNTELMGLLAGRYKRTYLKTFEKKYGESSMEYYRKSLDIAIKEENQNQIYYHAINLAFLSIVLKGNETSMLKYANLALDTAEICRDNIWKFATVGEAYMYIGDMEKAKDNYKKAADLAGIREKISIHTNAYTGYKHLMQNNNIEDQFVEFLKVNFLT
ncbi:caspase family protein [Lutibacter citreus]|uniref:caspase family protein n=1 Tax=Lutibacter citreus TaxID=2138210 RepID=UPI000DBE1EBE|nr:caspase family protein [Lutibacter citreus]